MDSNFHPTDISGSIFDVFEPILRDVPTGRVLDIATGNGGFIDILRNCLPRYTGICGIDISLQALKMALEDYSQPDVSFALMDAKNLGFTQASFDLINMSVSLHHMPAVSPVLAEIRRSLKPGGYCVISEMYQDGLTPAQRTETLIHHWAADIDTARGITHNKTLTREQIWEYVNTLDLELINIYDYANLDADPMDASAIQQGEQAIQMVLQRAKDLPNYPEFKEQSEVLLQRLQEVGNQRASILIIVTRK